jgi:alpha-1,3/alpha-1,6-mannosyltransferase
MTLNIPLKRRVTVCIRYCLLEAHLYSEFHSKGSLSVHYIQPPFPQSLKGKFHILFAHLRQLHLTLHILSQKERYDVYFVDQLATCVPFLRLIGQTRVVFYCHFPDKLLANGAFVEGQRFTKNVSLVKRLYRLPMDWLEETTTSK